MIDDFWQDIINNEDEDLMVTFDKIKIALGQSMDKKEFITIYIKEIQQSNQENVEWRDLKLFEFVTMQGFQENLITMDQVIQFLEIKQEVCYFVVISTAIFMTQKQFDYRSVTILKNILCRFNLENLSLWNAQYYDLFMQTKKQDTTQTKIKQNQLAYVNQILNQFNYENVQKKIEIQFNFFVNNLLLVPTHLDLLQVITPWLLQMKYITENDKQLVDKMLEVSFQLGEKQTFIYTKSLSKMLDCLKYAYKENDVFRPNKIVQRMIEDIPQNLYQSSLVPALFQLNLIADEWFQVCKSIITLGLTDKMTEFIKCLIKLLVQRKQFDTLFKIQERLVPSITIYLKFPKMRDGTLWLIECFTLGPPKNQSFISKLLILIQQNIKKSSDMSLFVTAVFIKYAVKQEDPLYEIILNSVSPEEIIIYRPQAEQLLKEFDWYGSFAQNLLGTLATHMNLPFKGLLNIGNTCYMNSLLQALYMSKDFRKAILQLNLINLTIEAQKNTDKSKVKILVDAYIYQQNKSNFALVIQLQRLFALMSSSKRNIIDPAQFRQTLPEFFRLGFAQHDSSELEKNIFDQIDTTLKKTNRQEFMKDYFEGELVNIMKCYDCNKSSEKLELYVDFNLVLPKDKSCKTENELIQFNLQEEEFDQFNPYFCDNCQQLSKKASKQLFIKSTAKYLVLTLNRFYFDRISLKKAKISDNFILDEFITIPVQEHNTKFTLYSILIHKGQTVDYGHYFTFIKDKQKWYKMNDSQVSLVGEFKDIQYNPFETPYMLFYEKNVDEQGAMDTEIDLSIHLQKVLEQDEIQHLQEQAQQSQQLQFLNSYQIPQNFFFNYRNDDEDDENGGNFGMQQQSGMGNNNIIF